MSTFNQRDSAALDRLQAEARTAHPARIARVAADLETEADLAQADAEYLAARGDTIGAGTARAIAARITRIHQALTAPDIEGDGQ